MCIYVYVSIEATGGLALLFCFNPLRTGPFTQHGSSWWLVSGQQAPAILLFLPLAVLHFQECVISHSCKHSYLLNHLFSPDRFLLLLICVFLYFNLFCASMCGIVCSIARTSYNGVQKTVFGNWSILQPCGSQGLNSGH